MHEQAKKFQIRAIRTPNPKERVVALYVPEHLFESSTETLPGTTLSTFLTQFKTNGVINERGFGDYVFTDTAEAPATYLGFYFAKPLVITPGVPLVPFKSSLIREPFLWRPWLVSLYGWVSTKYAQQIITSGGPLYKPRFYDRPDVIPGGQYESEILVEEFVSPTPFTSEDLNSESQIPTTVFYNYLGVQNSIDCLHDDVFVPEDADDSGYVHPSFGMKGSRPHKIGGRPGRIFPATGMTGWEDHVFSCRPQFVDGVYYLVRKTVRVPDNIPDPVPQ